MNDDPREVLALLNSLGFVGITAPQLKAFMKDLKLYRKVKDRESQQRKEEIKGRILKKQQNMISEILREQNTQQCPAVASTDTSNYYADDSLVKVRVRCVPQPPAEQVVNLEQNSKNCKENSAPPITRIDGKTGFRRPSKPSRDCSIKNDRTATECLTQHIPRENGKHAEKVRGIGKDPVQLLLPTIVPNLKENGKQKLRSSRSRSRSRSASTTRTSVNSGSKSFIRPWRLQPEAHRSRATGNSDPVTLYQKYQHEWKQMSFPGEAKHTGVRWAIREKMLGTDPHPVPLARKSKSMPILRKP